METSKFFKRGLTVIIVLLSIMLISTQDSYAVARFGTRCQADYENNWQEKLPYSWNRCAGFNNELDDTDTKVFYYNLHGAQTRFSSCDGCGAGVDNVHLFYVNTHGGGFDNDAALGMWNQNQIAQSNVDNWRFGNNNTGAAFFAQYACETLKFDGKTINRWLNTFKGGLIMATGSHDKLYDSITTDETGEDFADNLQKSKTVKWAWFDGNGDWYTDQDVAVLASGTNENDCKNRRDGVKWQNFGSFPRLRDNQIGWMCWSWISDN